MAQYIQVLSQPDKPSQEELRQFYPNIVENQTQTVQYLIRPDETFQTQQILVSSTEQLMVVEGQPQRVIVDQSQVTFQNQQYVLQDTTLEFQETQNQQVYYMDANGTQQTESLQVETAIQQPIVLNHQLPGTVIRPQLTDTSQKVMSAQRPNQMPPVQQPIRQQRPIVPQHQVMQSQPRTPAQVQRAAPLIQQKLPNQVTPRGGPIKERATQVQVPTQQYSAIDSDSDKSVTLDNGMSLARYKQLMAENKINLTPSTPTVQERLEAPSVLPALTVTQKRKTTRAPRSARGGRNTKSPRANISNLNYNISQSNTNTPPASQQRFRMQRQMSEEIIMHQATPTNRFIQQQQQQQPMLQPQNIMSPHQSQQPMHQPQYIIQPHTQHQQQQQCTLPAYVPSSQIQQIIENTPISEEYSDSIRMLVLLSNGEQRLITFTLPKEQCSIQEILEQVGVPIQPDTKIECTETNTNGINYIVKVGYNQHPSQSEQSNEELHEADESMQSTSSSAKSLVIAELPLKSLTPDPPKEIPKLLPGRLAVCGYCGYLSEDFNKCLRCKRKLPEDIKSVALSDQLNIKKPEILKSIQEKKLANSKTNGTKTPNATLKRKARPKVIEQEPIILTLSSDEEDDSSNKLSNIATLKMVESHIAMAEVKKEPSMTDIQQYDKEQTMHGGGKEDSILHYSTSIFCRIVRIGSYRFVPNEDVIINSTGVIIKIPHPNDKREIKTITIDTQQIVKVLVNFQKILPVIFYYVMPAVGQLIREQLDMLQGSEYYFDPLSEEEAFKRITFLPEIIGDETKSVFKQIYTKQTHIMDELTAKEANNILLKTCPKEVTKAIGGSACFTEIKQLLIYPAGKGGLPINTEDYLCLAQDQFLNDVIIDFYLKYVVLNLSQEQQAKVHVFSTFFYKRLTTKPLKASRRSHPSEMDSSLTAAQKRHARVKKWTKNVNLFEKDFIIIPINESCHWFLAIICFPRMDGTYTFDGKPIKLEPKTRRKLGGNKQKTTAQGSNITITQVKSEKKDALGCEDGDISDKDEAEGDDSELDSEEETEEPEQDNNQPIKQPCILIFDSLAGASRSRVVATLRDYLTCEYKAKMNTDRPFNKDTIKCACPKVPQQTNFTDCGLYLIQYVESFFSTPIKDYRLPISELKTWFEEITVTKKREDISNLIKELMANYGKDPNILPEMIFPTLNGKLVPRIEDEGEEDEEDDEEETLDDELNYDDDSGEACSSENKSEISHNSETGESESSIKNMDEAVLLSIKPSHENKRHNNDSFDEQLITVIKPDLSELKTQTNRDTLSYLKNKRIIRHKSSESSDSKKVKLSQFD